MKTQTSASNNYYFLILTVSFLFMCFSCKIKSKVPVIPKEKSIASNQSIVDSIIKDIDGNSYSTIQIGDQLWMQSNLRTTRYNNGKHITHATINENLSNPNREGMVINDSLKNNYGSHYNFYAIIEGSLCPEGWHIPSNDEWLKMIDFFGGECNLEFLSQFNTDINFYSEMGGIVIPENLLNHLSEYGETGYWWTSSNIGRNTATYYQLSKGDTCIHKSGAKENNFLSVRCVKDGP